MKKINLTTGGHKFRVNDLQIMQDGLTEGLIDLVKATNIGDVYGPVSTTAFKLWGANYTFNSPSSGTTTIDEGAIYWNGVIYPVEAHTAAQTGGSAYWLIQEDLLSPTALPNENVPTAVGVKYQDGTFQNVHVKEKLVLEYHVTPPVGGILASSVLRSPLRIALDNIKSKSDLLEGAWVNYLSFIQLQPYHSGTNVGAPISINSTITSSNAALTGESCYFRIMKVGKTVNCNFLMEVTIPSGIGLFTELRFNLITSLFGSSVTSLYPVSGTYYSNTTGPDGTPDGLNPLFIFPDGVMSFRKYNKAIVDAGGTTYRDFLAYSNYNYKDNSGLIPGTFKITLSGNLTFEINV